MTRYAIVEREHTGKLLDDYFYEMRAVRIVETYAEEIHALLDCHGLNELAHFQPEREFVVMDEAEAVAALAEREAQP